MIDSKTRLQRRNFSAFRGITEQKTVCINANISLPASTGFYPPDSISDFIHGLSLYGVRGYSYGGKRGVLPLTMLKLFTIKDAYFAVFPGLDGVIFNSDGIIVEEPSCFFNKGQLPHLFSHAEIKKPLENVFVGFDAACHNYYHWLLYAISKTQLANAMLPSDTILALPSHRSLFENRYCVYSQETYTQILNATALADRVTFLDYGIYPVKNLQFFWQKPIMPELYLTFEEVHYFFDQISVEPDPSLPEYFYISREQNSNARINTEEQQIIDSVLEDKSISKIYLEKMDFLTQVRLFRRAKLVISPHGAGLANMVFAPKNVALLELNRKLGNARHLRNCFYLITLARQQRYSCLNLSNIVLTKDVFSNAINQLMMG